MYLYNLTLQKPTAIVHAIYGNFSAPKVQEIIVTRGHNLELLRPDEVGHMHSVLSTEVFGSIRSISTFRLTGIKLCFRCLLTYVGGSRDYIILGTDSGRIIIVEYNAQLNVFEKVHQETFGRSGCRRIIPGQYLAADPKGRAVMIGVYCITKCVY